MSSLPPSNLLDLSNSKKSNKRKRDSTPEQDEDGQVSKKRLISVSIEVKIPPVFSLPFIQTDEFTNFIARCMEENIATEKPNAKESKVNFSTHSFKTPEKVVVPPSLKKKKSRVSDLIKLNSPQLSDDQSDDDYDGMFDGLNTHVHWRAKKNAAETSLKSQELNSQTNNVEHQKTSRDLTWEYN